MALRKVMYKTQKEGYPIRESDFIYEGLFHQWANASNGTRDGYVANYTVGIIETPFGNIEQVLPERIKFLDLPTEQ